MQANNAIGASAPSYPIAYFAVHNRLSDADVDMLRESIQSILVLTHYASLDTTAPLVSSKDISNGIMIAAALNEFLTHLEPCHE